MTTLCHVRRLVVSTLVAGLFAASCVDRARLNNNCQFSEPARALDLRDPAQRHHLDEDVTLAEELGVRYGDSFRAREGLLVERERTEQCTAALLAEIARIHHVGAADVLGARGRRDWRIDAVAVFLPMALLMIVMANVVSLRIYRRFSVDERWAALVAIFVLSLIVLLFWMLIGDLWSWGVETARLHEAHMSYRAFYRPWIRHPIVIAIAGLCLFWAVTLGRHRQAYGSANAEPTPLIG